MLIIRAIKQNQSTTSSGKRYTSCLVVVFLGLMGSFGMPSQSQAAKNSDVHPDPKLSSIPRAKLNHTVWWQIARRHQLDPYILYAVALVESRKNDEQHQVTPWPWAINNAGKSFIPANQKAAEALLNKMLAEGLHNVDVGMMQVNLRWHGHRVSKPEHLLNPMINLEIGAELLAKAIRSAPDNIHLGVGRYYSWRDVTAAVEYGQKVVALADQIRLLI